jgi:hypothetical protein
LKDAGSRHGHQATDFNLHRGDMPPVTTKETVVKSYRTQSSLPKKVKIANNASAAQNNAKSVRLTCNHQHRACQDHKKEKKFASCSVNPQDVMGDMK